MKTPQESSTTTAEETRIEPDQVTLRIRGNGKYEVRLRVAGMTKSQLHRLPAHGELTLTGPVGAHVFDAITRRLLFQIQADSAERIQSLIEFY